MFFSIKKITWLSKEIKEAEVVLSSSSAEIICFCHPCQKKTNDPVRKISALFTENIIRADKQIYDIFKLESYFSYRITAKLVSRKERRVDFRGLSVDLDSSLPGDIQPGEFITFDCGRLDIY